MQKSTLKEYEWYNFKIHKEISISEDESYYIITDPNEYKHLLVKDYYLNYDFKIGDVVPCRIDKINCSGKIYLEPEHPFYKEGNVYDFPIKERKSIFNILHEKVDVVVVSDCYNHDIEVAADGISEVDKTINCVVTQIKKGKLFISPTKGIKAIHGLKEGDWFFANISERFTAENGHDYYILRDKSNHIFYLETTYYENYNLQIGENIYCKIVKIRSHWDYVLEPKNPHYVEGNSYDFVINSKQIDLNYKGENVYLFVIHDFFDIPANVEASEQEYASKSVGETINCKVDRIKKSKLLLSINRP